MNTELSSVFFDSLDKIKFKQGFNTYLRPEFTQMGLVNCRKLVMSFIADSYWFGAGQIPSVKLIVTPRFIKLEE